MASFRIARVYLVYYVSFSLLNLNNAYDSLCRALLYPVLGKVSLSGVIVGQDPETTKDYQLEALDRALKTRFLNNISSSTSTIAQDQNDSVLFISEKAQWYHSKSCTKSRLAKSSAERTENSEAKEDEATHKKKKMKKISALPYGNNLNWQRDLLPEAMNALAKVQGLTTTSKEQGSNNKNKTVNGSIEVTISQTGLPQGITAKTIETKKQRLRDAPSQATGLLPASRISQYQIRILMGLIYANKDSSESIDSKSKETGDTALAYDDYEDWKRNLLLSNQSVTYKDLEKMFFTHPVFQYWNR